MKSLITKLGEKSVYDAVCGCTRCGFCSQACPTHLATGRETMSSRGRNQLVRLLLEDRFEDPGSAQDPLSTCLLCGACTTACPGQVPTPDLVLEGRRRLRRGKVPLAVRALTRLMLERPALLAKLLHAGYLAKRLKLDAFAARTGVLRLLGLRVLEEMSSHVEETPNYFLEEILRNDKEMLVQPGVAWLYIATCGPNYLFPKVGLATVKLLKGRLGPGALFKGVCCGLLAYNYGRLEDARAFAKKNIEAFENAGAPGSVPLVADCSSCAAFMKSYPQLFAEDPAWRGRAERFASRVRDVLEVLPPGAAQPGKTGRVTYHDSCQARHKQGLVEEPRRLLKAALGDRFVEMPASDSCCGGAGAFAFVHPRLSDELVRRKVANIASVQARRVATSSTSCLIQLARGLKKYYPECAALHVSELLSEDSDG
ncbi:MAG: (Fe-S)-binding protein [Elusimicrobiota bacterium]